MLDLTLAVAYGIGRRKNITHWRNDTVTWPEVCAWVEGDLPTTKETAGSYVFGKLAPTPHLSHAATGCPDPCHELHRNKEAIQERSAFTLDVDNAPSDFPERVKELGVTSLLHTTANSSPHALRLRLIVPADRPMGRDEFTRGSYHLMRLLSRDGDPPEMFDRSCRQPERLMYRPAAPDPEIFGAWPTDGPLLEIDELLVDAVLEGDDRRYDDPEKYVDDTPPRDPSLGLHPNAKPDIDAALSRLDVLPHPWVRGESFWDATTFEVACVLVRHANSGWTGYTLDQAEHDLFEHAPTDDVWGEADVRAKWERAMYTVDRGGVRFKPEPADDFTAIPGSTPAPPTQQQQTTLPLAVRLRERVEARYDVFPAGDDGRIFVQPKKGGRAELLTGSFVIRAGRGVGSQMSTLSSSATEAAKVLTALAEVKPPRRLALRAHQSPGRIVLDLAQPGNSRCVVVTANGWTVDEVPPADVVFQSVGRALPDPERGGDVDELRTLLRWQADDPRWPLVKGWLACSLLAHVPRPLLGFFGPQGSAKSTTGRFVVGVIDPKPTGALGSGFGKNRSDDETKALASYLVAWDNVSKMSDEAADLLSRLVTGDMIEKRRLYTDAELATIVYRRTGVITGISVPRGVKADTLDRLILLALVPLVERVSENSLEAEWRDVHARILAGVLDLAVRALSGDGDNPDGLRMADYAEALWSIDPALYRAYAANVREARADMASNDPFIGTVLTWLKKKRGQEWEGTATDARRDASYHQVEEGRWWPANGKVFMDTVTANLELLKEVGVTVTERKVKGVRLKRFTLDDRP